MPRPRVLSFGLFGREPKSPDLDSNSPASPTLTNNNNNGFHRRKPTLDAFSPVGSSANLDDLARDSPSPNSALQQRNRAESRASRPTSMIQTYSPAAMDTTGDTLPELQPVFSFLNSHSNKLYQEGYFLKLHDLVSRGRPSVDRAWTECFAQLVGTVLSLWDAAALDAAGDEGEVLPTFINLSDASIKMIESLPMNGSSGGTLQNVLSISTAANNRYLLHFNSLNSLTQWTAGIRLSMYEQATLQEAYTGSLIAGKGRVLNNIKSIMERSRFKSEDWARVRFGAGTPWRRCWCIISPPDDKEYMKAQKSLKKKNSYDRKPQLPKGDIKFYDTRRITKKTLPIATITDAYAAYAIYPQSKPLIDQSTLVKLEGLVTIHSSPETTAEGFVFVMPEVHPAVTGFEMMLRWLFPVWDTFALYGRPNRLIADTLDARGLMFAMPRERRYGYIDILDVSGLVHTEGSQAWSERQWRAELKKLTSHRMNATDTDTASPLRQRRNTTSRTSLPSMGRAAVQFDDSAAPSSSPVSRKGSPGPYEDDIPQGARRADTLPINGNVQNHRRSVSEAINVRQFQSGTPSRLSTETGRDGLRQAPQPPAHGLPPRKESPYKQLQRIDSEVGQVPTRSFEDLNLKAGRQPVGPVVSPPAFVHGPSAKPASALRQAPELRRATSEIDAATLVQMREATHRDGLEDETSINYHGSGQPQEVAIDATKDSGMSADMSSRKELVDGQYDQPQATTALPPAHNPTVSGIQSDSGHLQPGQHDLSMLLGSVIPRKSVSQQSSSEHIRQRQPVISPARSPSLLEHPPPRIPSPASSAPSPGSQLIDSYATDDYHYPGAPSSNVAGILTHDNASNNNAANGGPDNQSMDNSRAGRPEGMSNPLTSNRPDGYARSRSRGTGKPDTLDITAATANRYGDVSSLGVRNPNTFQPTPRTSSRGAMSSVQTPQGSAGVSPAYAEHNNSYFRGRATPSPGPTTPIDSAGPGDSFRRSMVWQPAAENGPDTASRQTLTPEQWVQHKASIASQPLAQRSTPNLGAERHKLTKRHPSSGRNSPIIRQNSSDYPQAIRKVSPPNPSQPNGRHAGMMPQPASTNTLSNSTQPQNLSAREQMHMSRATGTPLVNLQQNDSRRQQQQRDDPNAGLYGAIQARERDRPVIQAGYQSNGVQDAITQKQQQQMHAGVQARSQQQYQMQQAAQAAQLAHHQATMQKQPMYGQPAGGMQPQSPNFPFGVQQSNQHAQQSQSRPSMPGQWPSTYINGQPSPGGQYNTNGGQPMQQQRPQQTQQNSYRGQYNGPNYTRPSPR